MARVAMLALLLATGTALPVWADDAADCSKAEPSIAVAACRRLGDQGLAFAQFNLGVMYDNGQGVLQDYTEAVTWFRKAADQGHAPAQADLGVMYAHGQGVPQDYVQAHKWFNLAAARLPASDAEMRNLAVKERDAVAAKMTPAQIAEAERLAREWRPK